MNFTQTYQISFSFQSQEGLLILVKVTTQRASNCTDIIIVFRKTTVIR